MIEKLKTGIPPITDMFGLTHPMYAFKPGDCEEHKYEHKDDKTDDTTNISITSCAVLHNGEMVELGRATIGDRALLIYVVTLTKMRYDRENDVKGNCLPKPITFEAHDFFKFIGAKGTTKEFAKLELTLKRLKNTSYTISTNIKGFFTKSPFKLVSQADFDNKSSGQGSRNETTITITLDKWLHNLMVTEQLLQLHPGYFRLRPLEKRIYELVRKFCGDQGTRLMGIDKMVAYIDSKQPKRYIKAELQKIASSQPLPVYDIRLEPNKDGTSTNVRFMKPREKKTLIYETMPVKANKVPEAEAENRQILCYEDLFEEDDFWA